ncbi:MAG: hypothetical protein JOZ80_10710 [Acidobacteriaceae bacterium]|nr:hypothetical protein [Acidobacteriaceae bacterium]
MRKLAAVEEARALMQEAIDWGLWRWLLEKARVREVADRATAALDQADRRAKANWSDELKHAYQDLPTHKKPVKKSQDPPGLDISSAVRLAAKDLKQADDEAERARLDAEHTFDEAERRMSTDMAREGARKALRTYDLREVAIQKSEAASHRK